MAEGRKTARGGAAGPDLPVSRAGQRIGLFGGSFDPVHAGHLAVSALALQRFGLDQMWWLVSPGNPLKSHAPAALDDRLAAARSRVSHPRVHVLAPEAALGTRVTLDTVRALKARLPGRHLIWVMGSDNLAQLHRWHRWQALTAEVPLAIVARPGARARALLAPAARCLRPRLRRTPRGLGTGATPDWAFVTGPLSALSSTALRAGDGAP